MKKKILAVLIVMAMAIMCLAGCAEVTPSGSTADQTATKQVGDKLASNQATPTDISYSLERYNLIKRAYWVNGQEEKARNLVCEVEKPLGYIVLLSGNTVVARFIVDGKISSLNSYLTPDSEYYEKVYGGTMTETNKWLPDVDGSYGENDSGIFFFDVNGEYREWNGTYLYSSTPMEVADPVVNFDVKGDEVND